MKTSRDSKVTSSETQNNNKYTNNNSTFASYATCVQSQMITTKVETKQIIEESLNIFTSKLVERENKQFDRLEKM